MTGKNCLLLPVGAGDDGAHAQNEKINVRNYIEGVMYPLLTFYMIISVYIFLDYCKYVFHFITYVVTLLIDVEIEN